MTIHDASIRRVMLSAHARDLRWAKVDRCVGVAVKAVLLPFAVCGGVVMLFQFLRMAKGRA